MAVAQYALSLRSKGQGHTVTKIVMIAWLLIKCAAATVCSCCWHGTAHCMTALVCSCFCLLRLVGNVYCRLLAKTSHVVLDEIHERDTLSDFLMIVIRDLLKRRSGLKVVLMSATLNAEQFASYFGQTPAIVLFICCLLVGR